MRLKRAVIENYRVIDRLDLDLDPQMNVFFGGNGEGKTSVLHAIAISLGAIPAFFPGVSRPIGFLGTDRRGNGTARVALEATDGTKWERNFARGRRGSVSALKKRLEPLVDDAETPLASEALPIVAYYGTDRVVPEKPARRERPRNLPRWEALEGALSPRPDFGGFFEWFMGKEHQEGNEQRLRRSFDYHLPELEAVRRAIASMVHGVSDPMVLFDPVRFTVALAEDGVDVRFEIDQLSGGHRIMLAVAADLGRRMAQGNPHLDDPLQSETIVLIDEIELHLHPSWQQRVLPDLMRTFPNAQFLVTTHSPQVLTTVDADRIFELARQDGEIVAGGVVTETHGAEAGRVLGGVMRVDQRPAESEFAKRLNEYYALIAAGQGEAEEAAALRRRLEELSPRDPGLGRADSEIRRRRVFRRAGRTP